MREIGFTTNGVNYTPVRARRGRIVHAVLLDNGELTACGKRAHGFVVVPKHVNCAKCKLAMVYPCKAEP